MDARKMAQALGRRGGRARAKHLTPEQRRLIAAQGGAARRRSLEAMRRLTANARYVAVVRELRPPPTVVRMKSFKGRLPDLNRD
jgi:hypothetical protein